MRQHLLMSHLAQHRDIARPEPGRRVRAHRRQRRQSADALRPDLRRHARRRPRRSGTTGATCCSASCTCARVSSSSRASRRARTARRAPTRIRQRVLELVEPSARPALRALPRRDAGRLLRDHARGADPGAFRAHEPPARGLERAGGRRASAPPWRRSGTFPSGVQRVHGLHAATGPGLFAMLAGVLTAHGMNIVAARIATGARRRRARQPSASATDGSSSACSSAERWERVQQTLREGAARAGRHRGAGRRLAAGRRSSSDASAAATRRPTIDRRQRRVRRTTRCSTSSTRDRVGVLFAITNALYHLGLVIHLAKITTQAHQVLDVFYVTDAEGRKIDGPGAAGDHPRRAAAAALAGARRSRAVRRRSAAADGRSGAEALDGCGRRASSTTSRPSAGSRANTIAAYARDLAALTRFALARGIADAGGS